MREELDQLKAAIPSQEESIASVQNLDRKSLAELRSFPAPPPDVATVANAVLIALGKEANWPTFKKAIQDPNFLNQLWSLDPVSLSPSTVKKLSKYTNMENF